MTLIPSPIQKHNSDKRHPYFDSRAAALGAQGKLFVTVDDKQIDLTGAFEFNVVDGYVKRYLLDGEIEQVMRHAKQNPTYRPFKKRAKGSRSALKREYGTAGMAGDFIARVKGVVRVYEEVDTAKDNA